MITFSSDAEEDIARIHSFLNEVDKAAARSALDRIWPSIARLEAFPFIGTASKNEHLRQLFVRYGSAGYIVRYFVDPITNGIVITRIWHSRETRD